MPQRGLTPDSLTLPLRDIHLPPEIGLWPVAPGWWLLLGALLLVGFGTLLLIRQRQRRRYRRLALQSLAQVECLEGQDLAVALSRLLRQAALCHFPRAEVAGLSGRAWLDFLDQPFPDSPFSEGIGQVLADAPYRRGVDVDGRELCTLCRAWLKRLPPLKLSLWRGR